jgi:hypothetical protein
MKTAYKYALTASFLSLLVACGGGGGGGGSSGGGGTTNTSPTISNLRYTPTTANYVVSTNTTTAQITGTITYSDADTLNDVSSITIRFPGASDFVIPKTSLLITGNDLTAVIQVSLATIGTKTFEVFATDSARNTSNVLQGTFKIGYQRSFNATFTQNDAKSNVSFSWGETSPLPSCAKPINQTFTVTSKTATTCRVNSFEATLPDSTVTRWQNNVGGVCLGGDTTTTTSGGPVNLQGGLYTMTETSTNSTYGVWFGSSGNQATIDATVYCQ